MTERMLKKKLKKLEREYNRVPENAVLKRQRIMKSAASVEAQLEALKEE